MAKLLSGTRVFGTATIDTQLIVSGTFASTSTTTGALTVAGGAGIRGNLYVGGTIFQNNIAVGTGGSGSATTASQISTIAATSASNHFLTFVDSNNLTATGEILYTTSSFSINPATGEILFNGQLTGTSGSTVEFESATGVTATFFSNGNFTIPGKFFSGGFEVSTGTSSGSSTTASFIQTVLRTTSATHFLTFVDSNNTTTSGEALYTTSSIVINPGTGEVDILSNLQSVSTTTGALVVTGGVGVGGNLNLGGSLSGAGANLELQAESAIATFDTAGNFIIPGKFFSGGFEISTSTSGGTAGSATTASSIQTVLRTTSATHFLTFVDSNNTTSTGEVLYTTSSITVNPGTGEVDILSTLASTSTTTGALVVSGGVGIGGNLSVNGTLQGTSANVEIVAGLFTSTFYNSGIVEFPRVVNVLGTTTSVSTTTGALVVSGGAGIGRDLYVGGTIYQNGVAVGTGSGGSATTSSLIQTVATLTNANFFLTFVDANNSTLTSEALYTTSSVYLNPNTGVLNATIFNSTSDLNLKTNVVTITDALATLSSIRGVGFEWVRNNKKSYGVIAQEVEKVLPELVDGDHTKSVNYSGLIGFLIAAVKELEERIKILENKQ